MCSTRTKKSGGREEEGEREKSRKREGKGGKERMDLMGQLTCYEFISRCIALACENHINKNNCGVVCAKQRERIGKNLLLLKMWHRK